MVTLEICPIQGTQEYLQSDDLFTMNMMWHVNSFIEELKDKGEAMKVLLDNLLKELDDEELDKVWFKVEKEPENLLDICISIYASNRYRGIG